MKDWTFLTNHGHALLCIASDPTVRLKDVAHAVGITERAAQRIVSDLIANGYLSVAKEGRRNRYRVDPDRHFRHPVEKPNQIGQLLKLLGAKPRRGTPRRYRL
ncbi:MAG: AsnC family transcriptional regulator [Elusimicrobia bacterium]|nr:AsnC family transcriptional regulator [Elusimicrobiota bacterium]